MDDTGSLQLYRRRWLVLTSLALLNLSNNALWISYNSVTDVTGEYFEKDANLVDLLGTISFAVGIPFCIISTYVVETRGLKAGIYAGASLTLIGGLIRAISTLPGTKSDFLYLWNVSSNEESSSWNFNGIGFHFPLGNIVDLQFYLSVVGQAFTGMGNPFAVSLPTKVSQNWFGESERALATGILAMSLPLGIVFGQGCSPLFVKEADDVPVMNLVWFGPALLCMLVTVVSVRTSNPPTPPSESARQAIQESLASQTTFKEIMKRIMTNKAYLNLFFVIGGAVGFFNAISTQLSQLLCSRGYPNETSGLAGSLLLGTGFLGAIISGYLSEKLGKIEEVSKVFFAVAAIAGIIATEFMRKPNSEAYIITFCSLFGVFGFGTYPLGLELSVEATYPIDESIGTALIFLSGQVQGLILVILSSLLEQDLLPSQASIAVCSESIVPKDHTNFLLVLAGYMTLLSSVYVLGFSTEFKRSKADQQKSSLEHDPTSGSAGPNHL